MQAIKDPHCISHDLDQETTRRLVERLESRAKDPVFAQLFDNYVDSIVFNEQSKTLEIGCGSGAMARALVAKRHFKGELVAVDQSPGFIDVARQLAQGMELLHFQVSRAQQLAFSDNRFNTVIAHTLMSHVNDPVQVLDEIHRVLKKTGTAYIFDGDYSSLSYALPSNPKLGRLMDRALVEVTFHNPLIMRDLMQLLPKAKLAVVKTMASVVSEIGQASYFKSFADTYVPMVVKADLLPSSDADAWFKEQNQLIHCGQFFACCNYYTYIVKRI